MAATLEPPQSKTTRERILLYLAVFVALLGVPLFFYTTSVHRAHLPSEEVQDRVTRFEQLTRYQIPIFIDTSSISSSEASDLISATQSQIDASLISKNLHTTWGLSLRGDDSENVDASKDYLVRIDKKSANSVSHGVSPTSKEIRIFRSQEHASTQTFADHISQVLLGHIFRYELAAVELVTHEKNTADVVFPYSRIYNVVFGLFVEDGRPVDWQIEQAVEFIQPVFNALANFCKFKVSSQIHYYSKLHNEPLFNEAGDARVIKQSDLSTFINYGEWNLNTHDIAPSINFLVFFPKSNYENTPLLVENSRTNSFLIPQWGGVHIFNCKNRLDDTSNVELKQSELEPIFDIFASQLFELLGVPKEPSSPLLRVASFYRLAALKNLKRALSNLSALIKLSHSLEGISIPEATKSNVVESLEYFDRAVESLRENDFEASATWAGRSVEKSDKAFFEKEMVQQAYFPNEHKLAVFSPLLGPICSIIFFGLIKYFRGRKQEKAEKLKSKKDI